MGCISDKPFKSNTTPVNNTPGFLYIFPVSTFCRLMKLASMGEHVYVCDIGKLVGLEFIVLFNVGGGLASMVVVAGKLSIATETAIDLDTHRSTIEVN